MKSITIAILPKVKIRARTLPSLMNAYDSPHEFPY